MASTVDLPGLHQLHLALKEVQEELVRGPRQVKARDNQLAQVDVDRKAKEDELKQTRILIDRKNLELKSAEAKIKDLDRKLNEAASNREFDILKAQIAADNMATSVLQDEILELLDKVDQIQATIAEIGQKRTRLEADRQQFAAQIELAAAGLRQREAALKAEVTEAEKAIPDSIKVHYRRLVDTHGAECLAAIENGMCTHCFVSLTPQILVQVECGAPIFCSSCDRLLYFVKS
jgi:predicted  nucleic acid-binding Zn-ribbon protein